MLSPTGLMLIKILDQSNFPSFFWHSGCGISSSFPPFSVCSLPLRLVPVPLSLIILPWSKQLLLRPFLCSPQKIPIEDQPGPPRDSASFLSRLTSQRLSLSLSLSLPLPSISRSRLTTRLISSSAQDLTRLGRRWFSSASGSSLSGC